jgi:membrane protease YdiL (CAAX protease family)
MDVAAERPQPPNREAPEIGGQPVAWAGRDALLGIVWFIGLFIVLPLPLLLPLIIATGESSDEVFVTQFVLAGIAQVGIVMVAARLTFQKYGGSWERLGLRRPDWGAVLWAGGALLAALVVAGVYSGIIEWLDIDALRSECAEQIPLEVRETRYLLAIAAFVVIAMAPVCEEIFFRGFVFPGLARAWTIPAGIVVSALLFSGAHFIYKSFIPIAFVGAIFAFTYWRSGNVLSSIGAHLAFNSISIALIAAGTCDSDDAAVALLRWDWLR